MSGPRTQRIIPRRAPVVSLTTQQRPNPPGVRPDHRIATAPAPQTGQTKAQTTTDASTYFTKADGKSYPLYRTDRLWATVTVTLETAGPVAVGFGAITPVLSGQGILLQTGVPMKFQIAKGNNLLYIASTSVNRVALQVEPVPWLEQIFAEITALPTKIAAAMKG